MPYCTKIGWSKPYSLRSCSWVGWEGLLGLEVHAVEGVASERRQLEVDDLLADGLQLDRMGHGEPGRLLLEDHLSLLVELRALGLVGGDLRLRDEIVEGLVAPLGDVGARRGLGRGAAE